MPVPAHPILSLKEALRARLLAAPDLSALIGTGVHEAPPRGLAPPYLVLGDANARENGTSDGAGTIIDGSLVAFTRERGTAEALAIVASVEAVLADPLPVLAGYRLVALDLREAETRHDPETSLTRADIRFRAFIEPL